MTFWWIAKCGLDWLSLHAITWRTCQNPVRKPPTVHTVSFSGGNLSVDFTFSFQPRTKSSHKFVWLVAIKTNETFSVFSLFCKFFILKLQKNNNHKNSNTGGTENEQEDAWIKKTWRIVLVSILCPILCEKISYCKEHFSRNYCCLFFILSFFILTPFSVLKLSTTARAYFFLWFS